MLVTQLRLRGDEIHCQHNCLLHNREGGLVEAVEQVDNAENVGATSLLLRATATKMLPTKRLQRAWREQQRSAAAKSEVDSLILFLQKG